MAHLPASRFSPVFEPLQGKQIGFVRPLGNVGDLLIEQATVQLFDHFRVQWRDWSPHQSLEGIQELVFGGGGNMGETYRSNWDLRGACLETGLPVTILPQSFLGPEDRPFHRVFVRENASFKFAPEAILAPDLALAYEPKTSFPPAVETLGVFLRKDQEAHAVPPWYSQDPVKLARTPEEYLRLAARYESLITNRLHMAVAGILQDRHVILLPNSYHKNRSLYETWLRDLGCDFACSLDEALAKLNRGTLSWSFKTRHCWSSAARRIRNSLRLSFT
ncbi:MAG: polysaccharide pyruvyl transferase family protein [Planctomycetaceae bacterium]|nr:polysaccharide pyruvyl transferase family protein [Planctomycetaceae bacterium]